MQTTASKVLIIGASGFIGRHLVDRFAHAGAHVEAWSRAVVKVPEGAEDRYINRSVDLLSETSLPTPPAGGWDAVFHLAGESRPSRFVGSEHVRNTVRITARVASHIADHSAGCRFFLNSSAYVYAPSDRPSDEGAPTNPSGFYGLAKLLAEDLTSLHQDRFHLTIVRPFNLIGAGLPEGLFATGLLARLREGKSVVEVPAPDVRRDLLDIRDAVEAYMGLLAADYESGTAFNFCSGRGTLTSDFAAALLEALGKSCEVRFNGESGEAILGNSNRLQSVAQWKPKYGVADAAHSLVESQGI
jgi:nucleoside-diphosphate-sugar epimerase